ncbi:schlafen family member 11-like [Saccoglossus kowalevskii]|uniref:Schlafen family member 11-like n=1 Tax=Saccoglossus kowalevskii TaxID=10224 RepID=A0ABM0LVS8_SACKO|nr:PREDICTED: schlafen family member 11-like [Saccoglossus kowalevskii]
MNSEESSRSRHLHMRHENIPTRKQRPCKASPSEIPIMVGDKMDVDGEENKTHKMDNIDANVFNMATDQSTCSKRPQIGEEKTLPKKQRKDTAMTSFDKSPMMEVESVEINLQSEENEIKLEERETERIGAGQVSERVVSMKLIWDKGNPEFKNNYKAKICALLNSGGGILELKNIKGGAVTSEMFDSWAQGFEQNMEMMITPDNPMEYIDIKWTKKSKSIYVFVRPAKKWITISTNCYRMYNSQSKLMTIDQLKSFLQGKTEETSLDELPPLPTEVFLNEKHSLLPRESKQLQFKELMDKKKKKINQNVSEQIGRNLSAFANLEGGHLVYGVADKTTTVVGVTHENIRKFRQIVNEEIKKMEWGLDPEEETHYKITEIPVVGVSSSVIVVSVAGIRGSGGVYRRCPTSYHIQDGEVQAVDFGTWKCKVLGENQNRLSVDYLTQKMQKLDINNAASKPVYCLEKPVAMFKATLLLEEDSNGKLPIHPAAFYDNLDMGLKLKIKELLQTQNEFKGTCVCVHFLYNELVKESINPGNSLSHRAENRICDILLCLVNRGIFLITVAENVTEDTKIYNRMTAQKLKEVLTTVGGCTEKFTINYSTVSVRDPTIELPVINSFYPSDYHSITVSKFEAISLALTIVLLAVPSTCLSSQVGCCYLNLLTTEQFNIIYNWFNKGGMQHVWVRGPPGTGKTVVALAVARKLHNECYVKSGHFSSKVLYVAENSALVNKLRQTEDFHSATRKTFVKKDNLYPVKHIIMDSVQSYRDMEDKIADEPWYQKARKITKENCGKLWCFIDLIQKTLIENESMKSGIPEEFYEGTFPTHTLTKIIRNSQSIFKFSEQFHGDHYQGIQLEISHDFEGEKVRELSYKDNWHLQNKLRELLLELTRSGYSHGQIAILVSRQKEIKVNGELFNFLERYFPINKLEVHDDNSIVIGSIRCFSDLERPVVIGIDPKADDIYHNAGSLKAILCTRAMAVLIILKQDL